MHFMVYTLGCRDLQSSSLTIITQNNREKNLQANVRNITGKIFQELQENTDPHRYLLDNNIYFPLLAGTFFSEELKSKPDQLVLITTDQPNAPEHYRQQDTINIGKVLQLLAEKQLPILDSPSATDSVLLPASVKIVTLQSDNVSSYLSCLKILGPAILQNAPELSHALYRLHRCHESRDSHVTLVLGPGIPAMVNANFSYFSHFKNLSTFQLKEGPPTSLEPFDISTLHSFQYDPFDEWLGTDSEFQKFRTFKNSLYQRSWDNWFFSAVREMVPHDRSHLERVYRNAAAVITAKRNFFKENEVIPLLYACYLHDIGMQGGKLEDTKGRWVNFPAHEYTEIRKVHGALSAQILHDHGEDYGIDNDPLKEKTAFLLKYHQRKYPLIEESQYEKTIICNLEEGQFKFQNIPLQTLYPSQNNELAQFTGPILAAILRIADAADIHEERTCDETFRRIWYRQLLENIDHQIQHIQNDSIDPSILRKLEKWLQQAHDSSITWILADQTNSLTDKLETIKPKNSSLRKIIYLLKQIEHFKKHSSVRYSLIRYPSPDELRIEFELQDDLSANAISKAQNAIIKDIKGEWSEVMPIFQKIEIERMSIVFESEKPVYL